MGKKGSIKNTQHEVIQEINKDPQENSLKSFQYDENVLKLIDLLQRIFRIEKQEFTFGIYRLLNEIRSLLNDFLKIQLPDFIRNEFERQRILIGNLPAVSENMTNEVEIRKKVMARLYQFFSRYYQGGDFSPQRAYAKNERYLITTTDLRPLFYWINQDQYFIKSDRYFRDFSFRIRDYHIRLKIVNLDPAINNNKIENAFFLLNAQSDPIMIDMNQKEIIVHLQFKRLTLEDQDQLRKHIITIINETEIDKKLTQTLIFQYVQAKILEILPVSDIGLKTLLTQQVSASKTESMLQSKLQEFANKSNTDFFIHRDLEGFLTHELDFFLTNEPSVRSNAFQNIGQYLIKTLGLLENIKRCLWLKKKWVYKTQYIITLDKMPISLIVLAMQNTDQIEEWIDFIGFNPIEKKYLTEKYEDAQEFQNTFPFLWADTTYFNQDFKDVLIESIEDLDNEIDGILIKSDNFQALRLISTRYRNRINGVYIDPPYNTGGDEFVYKDHFEHSCWLSLMQQTLLEYKKIMANPSQFFISIDDNEVSHLGLLCDKIFGPDYIRRHIIVRSNPIGRTYLDIYKNHEYIVYGMTGLTSIKASKLQNISIPPCSLWDEKEMRTENGTKFLNKFFANVPIQHPKPIELIQKCIKHVQCADSSSSTTSPPFILDFFAGSGSTAHAILDLYYQDTIRRKYILIEMADYFEHLIIPRIKKVVYARDWNKQKPLGNRVEKNPGQSQLVKYLYLEQYEDTLNNTQIVNEGVSTEPKSEKGYTLQINMKNHKRALKIKPISDPDQYSLEIIRNGNISKTPIDLIESFNMLLGLHVLSIKRWQHNNIAYKFVHGTYDTQNILIIWRFKTSASKELIADEPILYEYISGKYDYGRILINEDTQIHDAERIETVLEDLMERSIDE